MFYNLQFGNSSFNNEKKCYSFPTHYIFFKKCVVTVDFWETLNLFILILFRNVLSVEEIESLINVMRKKIVFNNEKKYLQDVVLCQRFSKELNPG